MKIKILAIILTSITALGGLILISLWFSQDRYQPEEIERIIYPEAKLATAKTVFRSSESPQFTLNLGEKRENLSSERSFLGQVLAETEPKIETTIYYGNEPMNDQVNPEVQKNGGEEYQITLPQPKAFRPGKYTLSVKVQEDGVYQNISQDFNWGVLAINTHKSIYQENETAKIYFGVVDDLGSTVCDAKLWLEIKTPKGQIITLSTEDGTIKYSGECARDNVTYVPDYSAIYQVKSQGAYQMVLKAETRKGEYQIVDFFEVRKEAPFEIERIGPTRINPEAAYDLRIKIKANQDFEGEIIETVPEDYFIKGEGFEEKKEAGVKLLVWPVKLKNGETKELVYNFDAPDNNPEFHLLGPLKLFANNLIFEETRSWQIAVDGSGQYILLWDGDTAPTGWTCISDDGGEDFYDVFPRGLGTYGTGTAGSATHNHTINYVTETSTAVNSYDDDTVVAVIISGHTHGSISSKNVVAASNNPLYRSLKFIRSNDANPTTIPNGTIGIFDTTPPANWDSYSSQNTYFLRGGGTVGTGGTNTHTHSVSATLDQSSSGTAGANADSGTYPLGTHIHSCSGTSDEKDHQPPYLEVIFGKANQDTTVPAGLIAMFDTTAPSGWSTVSDTGGDFNGNFIKGNSSYGGTGGAVQHAQHANLAMDCSATSNTTTGIDTTPSKVGANYDHTHTATVSFTQDDNLPVYRDTIFAKKQIVLEGIIYSDDGQTVYDCSLNNLTVKALVNGAGAQTDVCDQNTGEYSISGLDINSAGDVITVFLDGEDPVFATTVTRAAGADQAPTDLDLYQNRVIVRHEDSGPITNENLDQYDSGGDPDIKFTVNLSGTYNLTVLSGTELHVWAGDNFDPGGTVTTNDTGGVLHVDDGATAYLDTATSTIGNNIDIDGGATLSVDANSVAKGNITVAGTLTRTGSPTLTLRGTNNISGAGSITFYILAVGDATATSATTISNSIIIVGGALTTYDTSTITTSGTPNVNISAGTGNIGGGSGSISFYNLTIGGTQTLQTSITVSNNLSVSNSLALNDKDIGITNGDFATTGSGTITCSGCAAGTATLSGTSKNIGGGGTVTVYNLILSGSYSLQTATTVSNDLTVNGTMSGSSNATVNGAFTGTGTVNMSGGTVEQEVSADENFGGTGGNAWTFSTLKFSNSDGVSPHTITTQSDSGGITASTLLQIGDGGDTQTTTLNAGNRTWTLQGTDGTPFNIIGSSSLTASTSTFSYEGANAGGDTTVQDADYNNLTINASDTFVPEASPLDVNTDLTITTGTLAMSSNNLVINDDLSVSGTLTISGNLDVGTSGVSNSGDIAVAGTLTQSSSGTTTVKTSSSGNATIGGAGTITFYNLTLAPDVNGATLYLGSGASQSITVSNDMTIGNGTNTVTVNADSQDPDLDINGSFSISANGTFQASSGGNFQIAKNFTNNNSFVHNSGTITFDSANDSTLLYSGATTFNNFYVSTGGKQMKFDNVDQTNVAGLLTLQGTDCTTNRIFLDPDTPSQTWEVNATGGTNIDYVDVEYSNAITTITADNSTQVNNNNTNWNFTDSVCGIGLSGTAYSDEGGSPLGDNLTVNLRIDGGGIYSDETSSGVWEIGGLSLSSGQIVTVYLDDESPEATTVMISDGTDQTNVHLYQNTVIVRADTSSISNANMGTGDDTDDDIKYNVVSNNVTVDSGFEFHVWTGDSYDPNGTVTTQGGADFHVDDSATAYLDTATSTIADDIAVDSGATLYINETTIVAGGAITAVGTVNTSAGTPTTTIRGTGNIGGGGTITFHNLTIGDATTASTTLTSTVSTNSDVSVGDGSSLELGSQSLTIGGGDLTTSGTGTVTCSGCSAGTTTVNGSEATGIGGGSGGITFYNLTIGGTVPIASAITVSNDLTANGTMSGSSGVTINGAVAGTGTVNMSGGTVEQRVDADENFGGTGGNAWTFSTLIFSNSGGTDRTITTQSDSGGITASTLLQIGKGGDSANTVLNAGNRTWTLSGTDGTPFNILGSSSLTASTSTFSYEGANAGGDTTVQDADYHNLTINASDTFVPEASPLDVNGDLTVTSGTLSLTSNSLNVGSTGVTDSGDISVSGSLTQSSAGTTTIKTSAAGSATVGGAGTLTFYDLDLAPSANGGTIYLGSGGGQTITVGNDLTISNGTNTVTVNATNDDPDIDVNGHFKVDANGTFQASNTGTFEVAKNFTNDGTFTHNSGEVTFDSANTTIFNGSGSPAITFNNFTCTTAGKTLQFTQSKTFRTEGLITVTGQSGSNITIESTTSTQWLIDHQGTENITYATIRNSGCDAGSTTISLDTTNSDGGNNASCWDFEEAAVQTRVKGNVKIKGGVRVK